MADNIFYIGMPLRRLQDLPIMKQTEPAHSLVIVPCGIHNSGYCFCKLVLLNRPADKIVGVTGDCIDNLNLYPMFSTINRQWSADVLPESKCCRLRAQKPFYINKYYLSDCWIDDEKEKTDD